MSEKHKRLSPVYEYDELLDPNRKNVDIPGFKFNVDQFENVIAAFVPRESVSIILRSNEAELDQFCKIVYGMPFKESYAVLKGIADMFMRKSFSNLSKAGNSSAINIVGKHFMDLSEENKKDAINITIVNDLREDE